ncbi:MAG: septum site-determining protein MinD [Clostridia bacterium]|nr:septum site-determining protein MinD [Clostridia bacterium]
MARKIVITSGKGGVGKTTICANLGATLSNLGFRVVIIDVDIGLNNLDVVMGIENKVIFDIIDVIEGRCRPAQALVEDQRFKSLYIMPSAHSYRGYELSPSDIKTVVDGLDGSFDYILIDCPAGVEAGFHRAVSAANEAIVVVTPHISSIRDADKVLSILSSYNLQNKGLVINRVRGDLMLNGEMIDVDEIIRFLHIPILGVIPEDDEITALSSIGGLLGGGLNRAWALLAENLHNGSKKVYDCTSKYRGLFGGLRRNIKRRL